MSLGRNVLKLTTSQVAAQIMRLALAPVIARMFTPGDFGVRQLFVSIAAVCGIIAGLRYELSIPLGRSDKEAGASFALSMMAVVIFSLFVLMITTIAKTQVAIWLKSTELKVILWMIPVAILIESLRRSLQYWAAYKMRFGIIAWAGFGSVLISGLTPIGWYYIRGRSAVGLLASVLAGGAIGALIFLFSSQTLIPGIREGGLRQIINAARQHRKFPLYSTWSALINKASAQAPAFILSIYFPMRVVGYYSLGIGVVKLPLSLLSNSISQVFFPSASREYHKTGELSKIVQQMVKRLSQIGIFAMVAIGFCGAAVFEFVFGQEWTEAGIYAQILSIVTLSQFITSPITAIFFIKAYQDRGLVYDIILASSRFTALILASRMSNPRIALGAYAIASSTVYVLTLGWLLRLSNVSVRWGGEMMLKYAAGSVLLLLPTLLFVYTGKRASIILVSLFLETVIYLLVLYRIDTTIQAGVNAVFQKFRIKPQIN